MIKQFENIKKRPLILHKYDRDVSSAEMELNVVCLGNHELANFTVFLLLLSYAFEEQGKGHVSVSIIHGMMNIGVLCVVFRVI